MSIFITLHLFEVVLLFNSYYVKVRRVATDRQAGRSLMAQCTTWSIMLHPLN